MGINVADKSYSPYLTPLKAKTNIRSTSLKATNQIARGQRFVDPWTVRKYYVDAEAEGVDCRRSFDAFSVATFNYHHPEVSHETR